MPRRVRLAMGGIPWHIIQRGNNRSTCFYSTVSRFNYAFRLVFKNQTIEYL